MLGRFLPTSTCPVPKIHTVPWCTNMEQTPPTGLPSPSLGSQKQTSAYIHMPAQNAWVYVLEVQLYVMV